jgi:competence protein ComFC
LADLSFKKFTKEFHTQERYVAIGIDDNIKNGYAHTAILNHALKSYNIKPRYNRLRATSNISYSGKSKLFREQNPRNFQLKNFKEKRVILVDDIITTGTTLNEAIKTVQQANKDVVFCLTLTDVSVK